MRNYFLHTNRFRLSSLADLCFAKTDLCRQTSAGVVMIALGLPFASPAQGTPIILKDVPVISQFNSEYDSNPTDDNQNGKQWCAPVASASALLWLASHYNRPDVVPVGANGQHYTTDQFVYWLGTRALKTQDQTGTSNQNFVNGLWAYLGTTGYKWTMDVYTNDPKVKPIEGPTFSGHATVGDLYTEMRGGEDSPAAVELLLHQSLDADGKVVQHSVVLQMLDNETVGTGALKRYPGAIMDPALGAIDNAIGFQFDAKKGLDTPAFLYDYVDSRDVYLAVAIAPIPEPSTLALIGLFAPAFIIFAPRRGYRLPLATLRAGRAAREQRSSRVS